MNSIKKEVDLFIIVYQDVSNFGENYNPIPDMRLEEFNCVLIKYYPTQMAGQWNEIQKRNLGLDAAKKNGCTHFIHLDTDEYYENFSSAKKLYVESGAEGSACRIFTYFKLPTLRFETEDGYFVPFIHKLLPETMAGNRDYPFYVDRTRKINCKNVVLLPIHMHHFSWIRKDIERKCRNSSAKNNISKGTMLSDYHNNGVKEGFYVKDYDKELINVENIFNIHI